MRLNKIILNNIFSFYSEEIINFDNITFIVAQNGLGKTSILNAIKVCLGYSNIEIGALFNHNSSSENCSISIDFDEFIINKSWAIDTQNETLNIKFKDGEFLYDLDADDFIKEKIPFFLLDLLFYDGEINSNILLLSDIKLKHLFEFIFDLDLLKNMAKDTLKASKELLLDDSNKDISSYYKKLQMDITKNEDELIILKELKISIEEESKVIQKDIQKLDKQIRKENKKLDHLKQELDKSNIILDKKITILKKAIIFEMPLLLNRKLKTELKTKNQPILEIKNQNELNKKLDLFSETLGLESNYIKQLFNNTFLDHSSDIELSFSTKSFKELLIEIKNTQDNIDQLKQNIKEIELNESNNEKFQNIQQLLIAENNKFDTLENKLIVLNETILNLTSTTKDLEKELTKLYKTKKDNFATIKSHESLISIAEIANKIYKKELDIKLVDFNEALKISTTEFKNIYSQIKDIYITNNLKFEIIDTNERKINIELLSAGQKQVLNFLIIRTILEFKNFSNFLMVDTPFGRLSNKNRNLIFNNCYMKFNQLSLLLTDSEFEFIKSKKLEFKQYEILKNDLGSNIREIR